MATKPITVGVVGLGHRGVGLAEMLRGYSEHRYKVKAVCDTHAASVVEALQKLELPENAGFADYHQLLESADVEAVLVETGAQMLAPISIAALNAGKHVMADVPMIFTRAEADELVAAVEKTGLVYCMAEQARFANFAIEWKRHIENGEIGEPLFIQGEYIHPAPGWFYEEKGGGGVPVSKWGDDPRTQAGNENFRKAWRNTFKHPIKYIPHELSPLLKIIDDRVIEVSCQAADARSYGDAVEMLDMECALMKTAKGRVIRIVNSFTVPRNAGKEQAHHWYHVTGTEGFVESARPGWNDGDDNLLVGGELIRRKDGSYEKTNYGWERPTNPWPGFDGGHGGLEAYPFEEWYNAIRNNAPNESNVYATIESVLPGILAAESVENGGALLEVPNLRKA
jgi:predicted dehydrogenase